mmetsp:Transcript_19037/g.44348  ORF Transcript_19037/g.44348 Transcript_19037/m.44348 type:complete len:141 (+) Transcript_19037:381-803(+)
MSYKTRHANSRCCKTSKIFGTITEAQTPDTNDNDMSTLAVLIRPDLAYGAGLVLPFRYHRKNTRLPIPAPSRQAKVNDYGVHTWEQVFPGSACSWWKNRSHHDTTPEMIHHSHSLGVQNERHRRDNTLCVSVPGPARLAR